MPRAFKRTTAAPAEPAAKGEAEGRKAKAACCNLPVEKVAGTNKDYANALLALATKLGFPQDYLDEIEKTGK